MASPNTGSGGKLQWSEVKRRRCVCGHLQGSCVVSQDTAGGLARRPVLSWGSEGLGDAEADFEQKAHRPRKGVCLCLRASALVARDKLPTAVKAERGGMGEG